MKKKTYEKPTLTVTKVQHHKIICSSPSDPIQREVPWWDGEGDSRRFNSWDDEDNRENE